MPRHSASETVGAAAPGGGLLGAAASAAAEPDTKGEAEAEGLVPALKRDRPIRQPVIPRKVWLTVSIVVAVLVLGTVGGLFGRAQSRINVPDVLGRSEEEAKTLLTQIGLEAGISGSRFSAEPKGTVLGQSPAPGARLARGSVIELIVSAGTEEVVMPDVVGDGIASAREALDGLGLALEIELVSSELASGTVLLTTPSPGVILTTGDVVYVQVATPTVREEGLKPYSLEGVIVVIDPGSPPTGAPDTAMEVSRRLRALLEASGASTWLLRSGVATNMPEAERAASARVATATVGIGISMATTGEGGRTVMVVSGAGTVSQTLAQTLTEQLNAAVSPAVQVPSSIDPVFSGQEYAALRIGIGALDSGSDRSSFIDPKWADRVAQAIYTGLGEVFGERQQP
ncbi:MAG: PASTA domain-containing protein [Coriobacteriia bacterium]|nr:PASTA domain-containing protein [Coriobacteriia bacterium]